MAHVGPRLANGSAQVTTGRTRLISLLSFLGSSGASPYRPLAIRDLFVNFAILAHVAELADAYGSGPYGATRGGSSPLVSIN
jgi:hypothetical protein